MRRVIRLVATGWAAAALMITPPTSAFDGNNPRVIGAGPRPIPPTEEPGELDFVIDCTAPAEKVGLDFDRAMAEPESWFARIHAMGEHSNRLTAWYQQQFIRGGHWTQAAADRFALAAFESPEMTAAIEGSLSTLQIMITDLTRVEELEQAGDKIGACIALQVFFGRLNDTPVQTRQLWAAIDSVYTREAERLNLTLPE